jgi:hypothetical protein
MINNQIEHDKRMALLSKSNDSAHRSAGASCLALTAAAKSLNQQNLRVTSRYSVKSTNWPKMTMDINSYPFLHASKLSRQLRT